MKKFIYLFVLFITACGGDIVSDNSSSLNGSGIYTAPILSGDYVEKPATSIVVKSNSFSDDTNSLIELSPNVSALVEAVLQPAAVKNASFFEVTSMQKKDFLTTTSCHTSLPYSTCSTTFTYNPYCSGTDFTYIKLQADKSTPVIITVAGHSDTFADNCSKYQLDNVTLSTDKASHRFTYSGETFYFTLKADKEIPEGFSYSTNGALNGFYYSFSCFSGNNTCTGFAQFLGKVGQFACKGESTHSFKIYADPFSTKGHTPVTITLYGAGIGRDENYPCQMK